MFNKSTTFMFADAPVRTNTTIHEHRAPTDESIKLFKEMQDKAFVSVISNIEVETNIFTGKIVCFNRNYYNGYDYQLIFIFNLGGERFEIKENIDEFKYRVLNKENLIEKLFEKVSSVIAEKIFNQAISENYEFKEFLFNKNNLFTGK